MTKELSGNQKDCDDARWFRVHSGHSCGSAKSRSHLVPRDPRRCSRGSNGCSPPTRPGVGDRATWVAAGDRRLSARHPASTPRASVRRRRYVTAKESRAVSTASPSWSDRNAGHAAPRSVRFVSCEQPSCSTISRDDRLSRHQRRPAEHGEGEPMAIDHQVAPPT